MKLEEWRKRQKVLSELLYNCSEYDKQNDEWVPFPIGIGWSFIHHKSDICFFQEGTYDKLVLCSITTTTDKRRRGNFPINREKILQTLLKNNIENQNLDFSVYFKELSKYKFVISPEGNGIDCHRHYEALIAGCIPIIEDSPMIREKYKGCPILFTRDYSEITESYLNEQYKRMIEKDYDFSRLLLNSYSNNEQEEIKRNGNYWSLRLSEKKWYE